jgi:predicted outer membrane protein
MKHTFVTIVLFALICMSMPLVAQKQNSNKQNDTTFVRKNIKDNMMEIQLSELAVRKSGNDSIKSLAGQMAIEHQQMLSALQGLSIAPGAPMEDSSRMDSSSAGATDSVAHDSAAMNPAHGQKHGKGMRDKMQALENAEGPAFDRQWLANMLGMHQKKLKELEGALKIVKDEELKKVITDAIPKVRAHTEALKSLAGKNQVQANDRGAE